MGSERIGPPAALVELLQQSFAITCFFETGALVGDTTGWAATRFERVVTIERSPQLHATVKRRFLSEPHVDVLFGDSRHWLEQLAPTLPPTIFWLDAHWSGDVTAGQHEQCPLLGEIAVIADGLDRHCVLIDDARLFMAPCYPALDADQWPTVCDVTDALRAHHDPYIVIFDDVIIAVPQTIRSQLIAFLHAHGPLAMAMASAAPAR